MITQTAMIKLTGPQNKDKRRKEGLGREGHGESREEKDQEQSEVSIY